MISVTLTASEDDADRAFVYMINLEIIGSKSTLSIQGIRFQVRSYLYPADTYCLLLS